MMMNYREYFEDIKKLTPTEKGNKFEYLLDKIFEDNNILISKRYRTKDTQQEIDGAVMIFSKVFLLEIKWESEDTLAASKLFSFLGKINSKIDGTLGIFISYNELKKNFVDSIRNGLKQNCILIHGKSNIDDIIDKKVNIKDYLEYCFIQASTKNRADVNTSEFLSLPYKINYHNNSTTTKKDNWLKIYEGITQQMSLPDFSAKLERWYSEELFLSKKIINVYNTLNLDSLGRSKFNKLIEKLIEEEPEKFKNILIEKFKSDNWKIFAYESFCSLIKNKIHISEPNRRFIIDNVTQVLNQDWEDENKASLIIDVFYDSLTEEERLILVNKYLDIYLDNNRLDKFFQKKMANTIFHDSMLDPKLIVEIVKQSIKWDIMSFQLDDVLNNPENDKLRDSRVEKEILTKYKKFFESYHLNGKKFIKTIFE